MATSADTVLVSKFPPPARTLPGVEKVTGEWALICTAHNLAKLTA